MQPSLPPRMTRAFRPEVLSLTVGLHILDSTDPAQVKSVETPAGPETSLYIVSSKSGCTLEPNIFRNYFFGTVLLPAGLRTGLAKLQSALTEALI